MVHATDHVRGELDGATSARFEEHLASCPSCRLEVEEIRETVQKILCAGPDIMSSTLDSRLPGRVLDEMERGQRAVASTDRHGRFSVVRSALAAAAAIAVISLVFFRSEVERPVTVDPARRPPGGLDPTALETERDRTVPAILQARNWLLSAQEPDGSWNPRRWDGDPAFRVALTGLTVLALSDDARDSAREAIASATAFLLRNQREDGLIGKPFRSALYNHAIGTLALIEANRAQPSAEVTSAVDRAASVLLSAQTPGGAWGYIADGKTAGNGENESISAWALQALVSARAADLAIDTAAIEKGFRWFEQSLASPAPHRTYRGRAGHECGHESLRPITIWAVAVRNKTGAPTRNTRLAADEMVRVVLSEKQPVSFYECYFLLKTLSVLRGPALEAVRSKTQRLLEISQVREGSLAGSWEPKDRWSPVGGRLYSTALAALALTDNET